MAIVEVCVPDIGDFKDVAVIEILVKVGDSIVADQSLATVESDKASMEIPSTHAGVVKQMLIKIGDKVNQGSKLLILEAAGVSAGNAPKEDAPIVKEAVKEAVEVEGVAQKISQEPTSIYSGNVDIHCDLLVLGGGPGGYSAAFRAADLGLSVVMVDRHSTLGGVCLNVGCIPSKALLHIAYVMDEVRHLKESGLFLNEPMVDLNKVRDHKNDVVDKLTGGLAQMAKMRKVNVVHGLGQFIDALHMEVQEAGSKKVIAFKRAIIAAGSEAVSLPFLPKDERIVDSTGALELKSIPKRMLVLGGGIIGLEMGTVYSALGARLDVVEMGESLMPGVDRDLLKVWQKKNAYRFDNIMLNTKSVLAVAKPEGIEITFAPAKDGIQVPAPQTYDLVLQAVGRTPNGHHIGADKAGIEVTESGFISVDIQMRTNVASVFAIGDIVGQPMLAHKAVHEGHVAAEVIAGEIKNDISLSCAAFTARVVPSVAYTDPEVAWVGLGEDRAKAQGIKIKRAMFPWSASGRALANGREEGFTKLIFDNDELSSSFGRIVGGAIVGVNAGDMIGEVALAIEMGADCIDIGATIHPHPTLGESIGLAAEVAHGSCTDLPPSRK